MSDEDIELLKDAYSAFARGDYEAAFTHVDPEFTLSDHTLPDAPTGSRGPDALRANLEVVREALADVNYEPLEFLALEDRILVRVRASGRARHTGIEFTLDAAHLWTVRDGTARGVAIYPDWGEGKAAAGLA